LAVDVVTAGNFGGPYWPVGALGAVVAIGFFLAGSGRRAQG
jgi:hypothetical protein